MKSESSMPNGEINKDKKEEAAEKEAARFERYVDEGVEKALGFIRGSYEGGKNPLENLAFHNSQHTKTIMRRVDKMLEAIGADSRARIRGRLFAGFHDPVQNWKSTATKEGYPKRDRSSFHNEEDSFKMARDYMTEVNKKEGEEIFAKEDEGAVEEGIMVTVASGRGAWDAERQTVVQPNLNEKSSLIARALALADIGGAGMDGGAQYIFEGNALFREENLDILDAMSDPEKRAALTEGQKENFRKRMLAWSNFQPKFADGRKARFEMEIAGLPEGGKEKLRKLFNKFDESVDAARNKAKERESMTFEELAKDFGY